MNVGDLDPQSINTLLTSGGITGTLIAASLVIRKLWITFSSDSLQSTRNSAERDLINSMSGELKRLSEEVITLKTQYRSELEELKKHHSEERRQISKKLQEVSELLEKVKKKNDELKQEALSAYTYVIKNMNYCSNNECMEEVKTRLLKIATDENEES